MTKQQLNAIRERLADLPAHILPDWVSKDIAALLAHTDDLQAKYVRVVNQATSAADELGGYYEALTPEVVDTLIDAAGKCASEAEFNASDSDNKIGYVERYVDQQMRYEAARAALESLKEKT